MGVTVGAAVREPVRVVWASGARSRETRARAAGGGFEDLGTLEAVTAAADAGSVPSDAERPSGFVVGPAVVFAPAPPEPDLVEPVVGLPNVVIYLADTLRADRLGCYGNPRGVSPNIDRFAADGPEVALDLIEVGRGRLLHAIEH